VLKALFQQTLETALILAIANQIFLFHRLTPLSRAYCATRFASGEKTARSRWRGVAGIHGQSFVGTAR
jgi:hypothetical protein